MDLSEWQAARRLFEAASDLPVGERADFVVREAGSNKSLRDEVLELLGAHREGEETTQSFLAPPGASAFARLAGGETRVGSRIGKYELKRVIGSGGMGMVYAALQETPRREVALKMLSGVIDKTSLRRFEVEAEVLGRLRHPNVAQVYEAGTVREQEGGERPFLVMELVHEARDIVCFVEQEELSLTARIELFRAVCAGVHHAHQRGVIHRDLKPGNLLVDAAGVPKVIDFGVARARGDGATLVSLPGTVVGTLATMSPEQVEGSDEIDTRSDVYSLGVVLYRLVCGKWPYEIEGSVLLDAARTIQLAHPRRPRSVNPELPRDVEWILLRALEKERDRRYSSVLQLSEDLKRFLGHEPVEAGPPSATYRARKFVRRNPTAALLLLSLVLGLVGTSVGLRRAQAAERHAESQREAAHAEADRASSFAGFLTDIFLSPQAAREGVDARVSDLLGRAQEELGGAFASGMDARVVAEMHYLIGGAYHGLTLYDQAEPELRRAHELFEELHGADDPSTLQAGVSLGLALFGIGQHEEAEALLSSSLSGAREILGEDSVTTCDGERSLGVLYYSQKRYEEAAELFRSSAAIARRLEPRGGTRTQQALSSLASALMQLDQLEEAEEVAAEVVRVRTAELGREHPSTCNSLNTHASILKRLGRLEEARGAYEEVLETRRTSLGLTHRSTIISIVNLAALFAELTDVESERELLRQAFEVLCDEHFDAELLGLVATRLADRLADADEVDELFQRALARAERELPPDHALLDRLRERR